LQPHSVFITLTSAGVVIQIQTGDYVMTVGCIHDLYPDKLRYIVKTKLGL
jgi:hypothetical protein